MCVCIFHLKGMKNTINNKLRIEKLIYTDQTHKQRDKRI